MLELEELSAIEKKLEKAGDIDVYSMCAHLPMQLRLQRAYGRDRETHAKKKALLPLFDLPDDLSDTYQWPHGNILITAPTNHAVNVIVYRRAVL